MKKFSGFILIVLLVTIPAQLFAFTYGFKCITNNSGDCVALEAQLTYDLTTNGDDIAVFTIYNASSGSASSVAAIYWDDERGVLGSFIRFIPSGSEVVFSTGGKPAHLPSEGSAVPAFDTDYYVTASKPRPINGINPGEELTIEFNVKDNFSFSDVLAAVNDGNLRVALHVQSYMGISESLVDPPDAQIPEPTSIVFLGFGLVGLAGAKRKFKIEK